MSGSVIPFATMWEPAVSTSKAPDAPEGFTEGDHLDVNKDDDFVDEKPVVVTAPIMEDEDDDNEPDTNTPEEVINTPISSLIEDLSSQGLFLFDEEKEYSLDQEGLVELVTETKEKAKELGKQEYRAALGNETLLNILENGGTVEDYLTLNEEVDFTTVPTVGDDGEPIESNLVNLVMDLLKHQGYDDEEVESTVDAYKKSGALLKQGEIAKKQLIKIQAKEQETKIEELKATKIAEENRLDDERIKFKEQVLATKEISGFTLSTEDSKKLYDFITKVGADGKTEFQKKDNEQTRLLYPYMVMKGLTKESLSRTTATEQVGAIKKKLNNFTDKQVGAKRSSSEDVRSDKPVNLKGISWMGM